MKMKRKRKNACPSPLLDDSPKRTKVHAQRKFAQGSNVNSPVITPIRELESDSPEAVILPEPVELLPIKRPNTEDFLTFLCFRGTPILPPNLNFFNTASIVDTNGQVHEIKSESSVKNGPIDIAKCGSSSEKPFVAFGVRKRADPIVISRQMDRKRRHALALQALRRKYQEQKMAKIRALTISKLSEKVTNKTLVRTNTVSKTETITKKTNSGALQKTKVVATKHIKVTTSTLKTTMRPKLKIKQNMCLRSFRGRFIQQELPFRKKVLPNKPIGRSLPERKMQVKKKIEDTDKSCQPSTSRQPKPIKKVVAASNPVGTRSTRSNLLNTKSEIRRKKIKRILIPNPHTIIKPKQRSLRLTTLKKSVISRKLNRPGKLKQNLRNSSQEKSVENSKKRETKSEQKKTTTNNKGELQKIETRRLRETVNQSMESKETNKGKDTVKDYKRVTDLKEVNKTIDRNRRHLTRSLDNRKEVNISLDIKRRNNVAVAIKKSRISNVIHKKFSTKSPPNTKTAANNSDGAEETRKRTTRQSDGTKSGNSKKETPAEDSKISDKRKSTVKKNKPKSTDKSEESDNETDKNKTDPKKTKGKPVKNIDKDEEISSDTDETDNEAEKAKKTKKTKQKVDEKDLTKTTKEKTKPTSIKNEKSHKNTPIDEPEKEKDKQTKQKLDDSKLIEDKCKKIGNKNENPKPIKKIESEIGKTIKVREKDDVDTEKIAVKAKHKVDTVSKSKISKNENATIKDDNIEAVEELSDVKNEEIVSKTPPVEFNTINIDDNEKETGDNNEVSEVNEVVLKKSKKKDEKEVIDHDESKNEDVLKISKIKDDKEVIVIVSDQDESKNEDVLKKPRKKDDKEHTIGTDNDESKNIKRQNDEVSTVNEQDASKNEAALKKFKRKDEKESTVNDEDEIRHEELLKKVKRKDIKESMITEDETILKRSKRKDDKEETVGKSQRPSRKSKEAAAIYMEILSHKLVNDGIGDDDNISIDSFPELPNVKRTEKRENELKAKAKTPKDDKDIEENDGEIVTDVSEACNKKVKKDKVKDNETIAACSEIIDITDSLEDSMKRSDNPKSAPKSDTPKSLEVKETEEKPKRLMRHSVQITQTEENDSDESFHVNVKVPKRKKTVRSRASTRVTKGVKTVNLSSSDTENSTTSDVNFHSETSNKKNKKFSKTKSMKKADTNYSDTDDEPLSKRTIKTVDSGPKSSTTQPDKPNTKDVKKPDPIPARTEAKPKRECAKLPQNYLPMLSSSDEDEIFHGFAEKVEPKPKTCIHAPPLLDLLNKDLGRRFGKEKVNMSNEQIEKWLKDSALAGSSIKKENDEMLKFGERIPTETNLEMSDSIDTEKLKESLLGEKKDVKTEDVGTVSAKIEVTPKSGDASKPAVDRKLIFRKSKSESVPTPNVSAFSPENESSVYAFGEENEEIISTPFRRPSRRPSSTATSKSEDESSKIDESSRTGQFRKPTSKQIIKDESEPVPNPPETEDGTQFYIPQQPTKSSVLKAQNKSLFKSRSSEKLPDIDEFKYKIPSSPSASSSSSAKLYKRQTQKQKNKSLDFMIPSYVSDFPKNNEPSRLVEAPVFHPTEQEFQDPLEYIERIRHKAEQFGICKIVPPSSFKPECKVTDDMRFTAYNQYVNKMLYRWGPNFKEFMAIKKYLETQSISLSHPPWIGGMEIDLPRLYQTVQCLGGLKEVIEKKKWSKVSELMKIPKSAQDRVTKLDDIYCKYLLPYDTLSPAEREKLFDEVETEWAKKESINLVKSQEDKTDEGDSDIDEDSEECITKGRNVALNAFYRIARNTMSMYFKTNEPTSQEVEQEYWKYVVLRENHICVHSGSIDCGNWGYGFPVTKNSPFAKHPWNLKMLTNNSGSILRSLGPLMGVTVPTLHFGMVFSACCWYRDPHGLPWIEYLHTGGTKIWYGVPNSMGDQFRAALKTLAPNYCKNKELWLPSDTVMVPPNLLVENNVSLCHSVQEPGQFIVVFPKAFTSSVSTGYVVSESVFFAPTHWLKTARALFDGLRRSNEPAMFSLDRLLMSVVNDGKCNVEIVRQTLPLVQELCAGELSRRERLGKMGEVVKEKLPIPEVAKGKKKKFQQGDEGDYECEICRCSLFLSMIFDTVEGITYCLDHADELMEKKELEIGNCKFMYTYDDEELKSLPERVKATLDARLQKKVPNKFAGMPTLLGRN